MGRKIGSLLKEVAEHKCGPIEHRVPAATLKKIRADLKEVVKAERAGRPIPGMPRLEKHFRSEYNVMIGRFSINRILNELREQK